MSYFARASWHCFGVAVHSKNVFAEVRVASSGVQGQGAELWRSWEGKLGVQGVELDLIGWAVAGAQPGGSGKRQYECESLLQAQEELWASLVLLKPHVTIVNAGWNAQINLMHIVTYVCFAFTLQIKWKAKTAYGWKCSESWDLRVSLPGQSPLPLCRCHACARWNFFYKSASWSLSACSCFVSQMAYLPPLRN